MKVFNRFMTVFTSSGWFLPVLGGFTGFMMQPGAAAVRFYLKTGSRFEKKSGFLPVKLRLAVSTNDIT